MKKIITLILITLLCSCSASFSAGKQTSDTDKVTIEQFNKTMQQVDGAFGALIKRLDALESKKEVVKK